MLRQLKTVIARLQNSNETTKKYWLWGASVTAMILIIVLWLGYMSLTIEKIEGPNPKLAQNDAQSFEQNKGSGPIQIFNEGLAIVGQKIKFGFQNSFFYLKEKINQPNYLVIEGEEQNFTLEGLEKIKPKEFP